MANKKISELPDATEMTDSDYIPIVQDGTTKKITRLNYNASMFRIGTETNPDTTDWSDGTLYFEVE